MALRVMREWIQVRQQLFRQVQTHVRALLGADTPGLVKYRRVFEKEFKKKWRTSTKEKLLSAIDNSDILFLADFHALQQSQRGHLRLLEALTSKRPKILVMECLETSQQAIVNKYSSGSVSEKEFLRDVDWQKSWGFPWENYKPLFLWAQKTKTKIFGANLKVKEQSIKSLYRRDRFAAKIISDLRKQYPGHQLIVIFGDLHLASNHLPAQVLGKVEKKTSHVIVYQNSEKIYFQLLEKDLEMQVDIVKLDANKFCVLNVPPWVKWQNYLLFLEDQFDSEIEGEDRAEFTDHVDRQIQILAKDLKVTIPQGFFSVYTSEDVQFWHQVKAHFSMTQRKWVEGMIGESSSFYLPELKTGYLSRYTVNFAAALGMGIVHAHLSQMQARPWEMPKNFLALIWIEALQYFGSKLINPKRKTETIADIKAALAAQAPSDFGKEALKLALAQKMQEFLFIAHRRKSRSLPQPRQKSNYRIAARLLGGMLGEKIFYGFRKRMISANLLQKWLKQPIESEEFSAFYFEMLEFVENLPEPFRSKRDKL